MSTKAYQSIAKTVFEALKAQILDGELAPRERLVIRRIARDFNCSEIPVREAISSLESMGYVETLPHTGASVAPIDARQLIDVTELRLLLEPEATAQGAALMSAEDIENAWQLTHAMELAVKSERLDRYYELNRQFHELLICRCPNEAIVKTIAWTRDETKRARPVFQAKFSSVQKSLETHKALLLAIQEKRFDEVKRTAEKHCQSTLHVMRQSLSLG